MEDIIIHQMQIKVEPYWNVNEFSMKRATVVSRN